jgi:chromosomal replication initiator protein
VSLEYTQPSTGSSTIVTIGGGTGAESRGPSSLGFLCGPENPLLQWLDANYERPDGGLGGGDPLLPQTSLVLLQGPSGSGKSLLLHILAAKWKASHPHGSIVFTTGSDFCRDVANALRGQLIRWREDIGRAGIFVLDDLSRVAGHEQAQRELALLLDEFEALSVPVLMASSHLPHSIQGISAQLASRLSAGISIPILPPEMETRFELLSRIFLTLGWEVREEAIKWLANILHGTPANIAQAIAEKSRKLKDQQPLTLKGVKSCWSAGKSTSGKDLTLQQIIACVARYSRCSIAQLTGSSRKQHLVRARGTTIYLLRNLTNCSYREIGKSLGGRDHSTIRSAFENAQELLLDDVAYRQEIEVLTTSLQNSQHQL